MSQNTNDPSVDGSCTIAPLASTDNQPTFGTTSDYRIPENINSLGLSQSAGFYSKKLRFAVHPLTPSGSGESTDRGKRPLLKKWRNHTHADVTPEFLAEHFSAGSNNNIGVVIAPPHIVVDLDSKPDKGASVREWLAAHHDLDHVPREITGGGAHLHFRCNDLPEGVFAQKTPLVAKLDNGVQAELFSSGNVVLSPSTHASGQKYRWEVFGDIPSVPWSFLVSTFGFAAPVLKKRGRPAKQPEWWHLYPQDLGSLDAPGMMEELGLHGKLLDNHPLKYSARCPWAHEHSNGSTQPHPGSDTAILCPSGKWPVFKCLHAHCSERGLEHLLAFAEAQKPGIVGRHCSRLRIWSPGSTDDLGREQVVLPGKGRPMREFCRTLGTQLEKCKSLFRHGSRVVEIEMKGFGGVTSCTLSSIQPAAFITALENCVEVGSLTKDEAGHDVFVANSMSEDVARVVLASRDFRNALPEIRRVLNVRIPMLDEEGVIVLPDYNYDERFKTFVDPNAPELVPMTLADAKTLLGELLAGPESGGFWWKDNYAKDLALARILTPYAHGLTGFKRGPVWAYNGNLQGVGKDTCAGVPLVLYTGHAPVGAPLNRENDDEMRKRFTSTVVAGERFLHVANLKGDINFPSLEAATDNSGVWEDRVLGSSTRIQLPNEVEVSMSFNGASWTPDLGRRLRVIDLHCPLEDLGSFDYRHPDILGLVRENRSLILSALHALVMHWDEQGRPCGPTAFASFPQWGAVVGGILTCCGYSDPCLPQLRDAGSVGGDETTASMKELFRLAFARFGDTSVRREHFIHFVVESEAVCELFDACDFNTPGGRSSFMRHLLKYNGRMLGDILFVYTATSRNRGTCRFSRPDGGVPLGNGDLSVAVPAAPAPADAGLQGLQGLVRQSPAESKNNPTDADASLDYFPSGEPEVDKSPKSPKSLPPRVCASDDHLLSMASELMHQDKIAAGLIHEAKTRRANRQNPKHLQLQAPGARAWRVDVENLKNNDMLKTALRLSLIGKTLITYDTQPLLRWLQSSFGFMPAAVRCIRTASRLLTNGTSAEEDLATCHERYLPTNGPEANARKDGHGLKPPGAKQPNQASNEAGNLHALLAAIEPELERNGLIPTWLLENEVKPAFAAMEVNGIHVDLPLLTRLANDGDAQAKVLLAAVNDGTSRIHSTFDPLGTVTGRASSSNPPLQNVKRGILREVFAAPEGRCLVIADYKNIDLRVVAAVARDEAMLEVFNRGEDLHTTMAAALFQKQPEVITPDERKIAKAMNLGFINGQNWKEMIHSAKKVFDLSINADHTWPFCILFEQSFPRIIERINECQRNADAGVREVHTRIGRRRLIPDDTSGYDRRGILLNTPIQGGTADGMKKAMVLLHERLPAGALLVSNIHDELIIECPNNLSTDVSRIVNESMVEGMNWAYPDVCIDVAITVGKTWADKDHNGQATR